MKKKYLLSIVALLLLALAACGGDDKSSGESDLLEDGVLTVGVTAGPHEEIIEKLAEIAKEDGLKIETMVFSDYVMPNVSLAEGEIDINSFQTEPYLDVMIEERNLDIVKVADTVTFPMGVYSETVESLDDIPEGATLGLPGDPSNSGRALLLFEQAGLITLKEGVGVNATVNDVVDNPKNIELLELDSAQIPRQLGEVDAAAINSNFAIEAGLSPTDDSIFIEQDSTFVNLIATRTENKDDEVVQQFIDLYQTDEMKEFIEENFNGSVIPGW
ncbi:MetQ/NlpA family ABC transporter substrate-binding protein [Oceanobacillus sp. J11TS1]|uniref:MetQ/NlpA family ABC transporter substrate-binding protein n=1 Tax=Oceanobacillus sp. J11TS1 TaxID=2807191 RepID=UPI001B23EA65|nr:MetQ/NlpA family ABC transporter substrate-binding protein [Oceanobacillus sp. J11TS1]GIO24611.1 lipoprotein [Oceanobacillus sp. J11TS1]